MSLKDLLKSNRIPYIALNRTYYLDRDDCEQYEVLKSGMGAREMGENPSILRQPHNS